MQSFQAFQDYSSMIINLTVDPITASVASVAFKTSVCKHQSAQKKTNELNTCRVD